MKLYKLTDQDGYTRKHEGGETQWCPGFRLKLPVCKRPELCTSQVIHAYRDPDLALILNPYHANIVNPKLWECSGVVCCADWGKVGTFSLKTIRILATPEWYSNETVRKRVLVQFSIRCWERAWSIFEQTHPKDDRLRTAIEAEKEYLKTGKADVTSAARSAAHAAYAAYTIYTDYAVSVDTLDFAELAREAIQQITKE